MKNTTSVFRIIACMIVMILWGFSSCFSQNYLFNNNKHKIGINVGYGGQNLSMALSNINNSDASNIADFLESQGIDVNDTGLDVKYFYEVFYFQLQYYYILARGRSSSFELLAQPQYNRTYFKQEDNAVDKTKGYELGINVGFLARQNLFRDFFSFYAGMSSGPHYVSGTPNRQSDGLIFSSNFFAGMNMKILRNVYLDIRPGFRHISNAGLKHPNDGINNFFINGGFFIAF